MQFLSAKTILYARVGFLTLVSYLLVADVDTVVANQFTLLFGQAMELPVAHVTTENPLLGILAVIFGLLAFTDLLPLLAENIDFFETMVPARLMVFFIVGAYTYFSNFALIANNLVFTYCFFEIWLNFLIYNNLRDEKYYRLKKYVEEHGEEIRQKAGEEVIVIDDN